MKLPILLRALNLHKGKTPKFFCASCDRKPNQGSACQNWPISGAVCARGAYSGRKHRPIHQLSRPRDAPRADLRFARARSPRSPLACGVADARISGADCSSTRQISRSLDAMIHPLAICSLPPRHPQSPPDEIEVAWDALSNTYVCLFDGACRLALEATSPAERAVPRSRHTKWSKV